MKVISILSQKGGCSKSTIALNLAIAAERAGFTTIIFDMDPQASVSGWKDTRGDDPPDVASIVPGRLAPALQGAEKAGAKLVIIDTPPNAETSAVMVAKAADLILIPCRPSAFDLRAVGATANAAQAAGKPVFAILTFVPPGAHRLADEATAALRIHGLQVTPHSTCQRAAYGHASALGLGVLEYEPTGVAATEITSLWQWLADSHLSGVQHETTGLIRSG